jgi:hypothetical protein
MHGFIRTALLCLAALFALPTVVACKGGPMIPGTQIPDTPEHREILRVLERYRTSFVRRDAAGVLATAHPTYYDEAGTDDPGDDLTYDELGPMLRTRMAQIDSIRYTIDYLEIQVVDERAVVKVWIDASFRLASIVDEQTGSVRVESEHTRKQDHALFELVREGQSWRITKGL